MPFGRSTTTSPKPNPSVKGTATSGLRPLASVPTSNVRHIATRLPRPPVERGLHGDRSE